MKKIAYKIVFLLPLIVSTFSFNMETDNVLDEKNGKNFCFKDLKSYIIMRTIESISLPKNVLLTPQHTEYIRAQNKSKIHNLSSLQYINYNNKIANFHDNSICVIDSDNIEKKLCLSNEENGPIKSISFNGKGDQIAAIDNSRLYVWNLLLKDTIMPFYVFDFTKIQKEKMNTFHSCTCVALNDEGKAAINVETTTTNMYQNESCTYHNLIIINIIKNHVCNIIDLNAFYPKILCFITNNQLMYSHREDDIKRIDLKSGISMISKLNDNQKEFLYSIYKQNAENEIKDKNDGILRFDTEKQVIYKSDDNHGLFLTLDKTIQDWAAEMVYVEGYSKKGCAIC